ncbi:hypothetical protein [Chitinimonas naiadis]
MAESRLILLKIIARLHPQVWEVVGGGPLGPHSHALSHLAKAGPSPEPWRAGPHPEPWRLAHEHNWLLQGQLAAIDLTRRITDAASLTQVQGGDGAGFIRAVLDDGWGIEGRPLELHFPRKWWHGWVEPPPRPDELDLLSVFGAAGVSFATLSEQIKDEALSKAVAGAGLRLLDMAVEAGGALNKHRA